MDLKRTGLAVVLVAASAVMLFGCTERAGVQAPGIPAALGGEPVDILVCLGASQDGAGHAADVEAGIRAAEEAFRQSMGRNVRLVFRTAGLGAGLEEIVRESLQKDDPDAAIIYGVEQDTTRVADMDALCSIPAVIIGPWEGNLPRKKRCAIRLSRSRRSLAEACAQFVDKTLRAGRIGLVVDGGDPAAARFAVVFSSALSKTPSRIVHVALATGGVLDQDERQRFVSSRMDAVLIAVKGEKETLKVLADLKAAGRCPALVLTGPPVEGDPSGGAAWVLDGVYVQSDFIEDRVDSPMGKDFVSFFHRNEARFGSLGLWTASGAEAYLVAVRLVSDVPRSGLDAAIRAYASRGGVLMAGPASLPAGSGNCLFAFGRYERGFNGKASLRSVALVTVERSDPVADIRTEELFRDHGEIGLVDAFLDHGLDVLHLVRPHVRSL